ncbi:uncharacterized protein LOC114741444 [Neltuma alba]|uniref:uncharacterized protein LOC114741444 n=1 Tax=Neltuma alba TaxID=207710 RepID=UPI0010A30A38|nr:uncharacterized protein LOC114741444 [Prosopis alba]
MNKNILAWNCRGAGGKEVKRDLRMMIKMKRPEIVSIMETRVPARNAQNFFRSLGFMDVEAIEGIGFAGGIWVAWNKSRVSLTCLEKRQQYGLFRIQFDGEEPWHIVFAYVAPRDREKEDFWRNMERIAKECNGPWMVLGDFNDIRGAHEKKGGAPINSRRCDTFEDRINKCGLLEVASCGNRFTWKGPLIHGYQRVYERLDRGLCSADWKIKFPEAIVKVLARLGCSDHHPILLSMESQGRLGKSRSGYRQTCNLQRTLSKWNKEVFLNVHSKKKRLLARLEGIQNQIAASDRHYIHLCKLEQEIQGELRDVLRQEEMLWFQKSRTLWINDGDRNTRYYHLKTVARRRRNKIAMLKDENGEWIENQEELKSLALEFYRNLFREEGTGGKLEVGVSYPRISERSWDQLERSVNSEEIREAMFSIGAFKAPGMDGFPAVFFQKEWHVVEEEVVTSIKKLWNGELEMKEVNDTLIVLIPKVDRPENMKQLRPIALCNVLYKCISKILVKRLKGILGRLVAPNQVSFVPGRHIQDNIIVTHELLHSMRSMRGRKGFFAIKVDLEKAYDRVRWGFIQEVLEEMGMKEKCRDLLMRCIKSVGTRLLWNGEKTEAFLPSRGIRQGDPLSPYVFVLVMERLTHIIQEAERKGEWKAIRIGRRGPSVTHLMFADDLLLFGEATLQQIKVVKDCLRRFGEASGQKVNFAKSAILFSKNVSANKKESLAREAGFRVTEDLGIHLGVPTYYGRNKTRSFGGLVEKVKRRLGGWKVNVLSMAGRVTLAKSVISAIPLYSMMVTKIPTQIIGSIERAQRAFIWGHSMEERKMHLINWETVQKPRDRGGLGVLNLQHMNEACLMKLVWRLRSEGSGLWADVLRYKYNKGKAFNSTVKVQRNASPVWKDIGSVWEKLNEGIWWGVESGENVNFWRDEWAGKGVVLINERRCEIEGEKLNWVVADLVKDDGSWDWSILKDLLSDQACMRLQALRPPIRGDKEDRIFWGNDSTKCYSVRSGYRLLRDCRLGEKEKIWDLVWKWKGPERIRNFLWILANNSLHTNNLRNRRWGAVDECGVCAKSETSIHVVRDCELATRLWFGLNNKIKPGFFNSSTKEWLVENLKSKEVCSGVPWAVIFGVACWSLWKRRNLRVFEQRTEEANPWQIWSFAMEVIKAREADKEVRGCRVDANENRWSVPERGWVKVNSDGSSRGDPGPAGCGGVLRDHEGEWIVGFGKGLGWCTAYEAECWGAFLGLQLALEKGYQRIHLEVDSECLVKALRAKTKEDEPIDAHTRMVRDAADRCVRIRISHTQRTNNGCADAMAKWSASWDGYEERRLFSKPPSIVEEVFNEDKIGSRWRDAG